MTIFGEPLARRLMSYRERRLISVDLDERLQNNSQHQSNRIRLVSSTHWSDRFFYCRTLYSGCWKRRLCRVQL
jgi:hypothetical protein